MKRVSMSKTTKTRKASPIPTDWIEKTPEGNAPPGVLLVIMSVSTEEDTPAIDVGYYSEKLQAYMTLDAVGIEEHASVAYYHILHTPEGKPFYL